MLSKLPISTLVLIFIIVISVLGLVGIASYDNRSSASKNIVIPESKYETHYQLDSDNQKNLEQNPPLKSAVVKSINSLDASTSNKVYVMEISDIGPTYISIFKVVSESSEPSDEGYMNGKIYKVIFVPNSEGNYNFAFSTEVNNVRRYLADDFILPKLSKEINDKIDDILYEGDTTLYQKENILNLPPASAAVSGVTYKFPWDKKLGEWKITNSWHLGRFYINGKYYSEHALDVKSPLFTKEYESANEVEVLSPVSGIVYSRCNYDPYNNGYILLKGDDGIYYSIIHIKVNSILVKTGDRVNQGKFLGYMFEDGNNQDRWTIGQSTSGRCAWASGTHLHLGMVPVNNTNLINGIRVYNLDGVEMHYPNDNGNASLGKSIYSTQISLSIPIPSSSSSTTSSTTTSSANTSNNNELKITFKANYNLNVRKCALTSCSRIGAISYGAVETVVCKYKNVSNQTWIRIDKNSFDSISNNKWVIADTYYGKIYINDSLSNISDQRIPTCKGGN